MEQENLEEFLTPITPTKHRFRPYHPQQPQQHNSPTEQQSQQQQSAGQTPNAAPGAGQPPDSPSKAQARSRLGSLLGQIRKGDSRNGSNAHQRDDDDELGIGGKRGPGRPKKREKRKKREEQNHPEESQQIQLGVVFELRGKPFGLRDSCQPESIYALCRKWMYGKDDDLEEEADSSSGEGADFDIPRFKSLDLMATREIHALPLPRHQVPLMDPRPQKVLLAPDRIGTRQLANAEALLGEHKKHWKNVKRNWMNYNQKRQQRYADSLQLLRTVHGIAQQTQI